MPPSSTLAENLAAHGFSGPGQLAGLRWNMGCVSLEVTQRCNLDCTLCYLSEMSEALLDPPLEELLRRIDMIAQCYGADTDIQISGGDPTLRKAEDLIAIVRHIRGHGMRCSLFTNGILATRNLLTRLADAGLNDVAFHVDMTQQRKHHDSETSLNAVRTEYLARARGLGLSVFFNTTIHGDNLAEVPALMRFFLARAQDIDFVSFQMQADTGRGVLGGRAAGVTQARMEALIAQGAGTRVNFDTLQVGHPECNRYGFVFTSGGVVVDPLADAALVHRFMAITSNVRASRGTRRRTAWRFIRAAAAGGFIVAGLGWLARLAWRARHGLLRSRGRVDKLSIMTHNFMDAGALDDKRLACCVFMAAGPDGPVPMCEYNAHRDTHLLRTVTLSNGERWEPLAGRQAARQLGTGESAAGVAGVPIKWLKGRSRERAMQARRSRVNP